MRLFPICLRTLGVLGALGFGPQAHAMQTTVTGDPELLIDVWTRQDGLPVNQVTGLTFGPKGYLWLASFDGLVRFDGQHFETWRRPQWLELPSNRFIEIFTFADHVWAIGEAGNLVRIDEDGPRVFRVGEELPGRARLTFEHEAELLLATEAGLRLVDPEGHLSAAPGVLAEMAITTIVEDGRGGLWLGTQDSGLVHWRSDDQLLRYEHLEGQLGNVRALGLVAPGVILAGGNSGAVRLDDGVRTVLTDEHQQTLSDTYAVGRDADGTDWLVCKDGWHTAQGSVAGLEEALDGWGATVAAVDEHLWRFAQGRASRDADPVFDGLTGVRSVTEGPDGSLWFGAGEGLVRLRRRLAHVPLEALSPPTGSLGAVLVREDGEAWTVSRRGQVWRQSGPDSAFERVEALGWSQAGGLFEDTDGSTLLTLDDGPCRLVAEGCQPVAIGREGDDLGAALAVLRSSRGLLWMANDQGVWRTKTSTSGASTWLQVETPEGVPLPPARALIRGPDDDSVIIGTHEDGLLVWREDGLQRWGQAEGLSSDRIRALHLDEREVLWVGTEDGGLCRLELADPMGGGPVCLGQAEGLVDDVIHSILPDGSGRLWLSSNRGIFWVHREALDLFARGASAQVVSIGLTAAHGMPDTEANGGAQPAGYADADGRFWYVTVEGLTWVEPAGIETPSPPGVYLESVSLGDAPPIQRKTGQELCLKPDQREITVRWSSPAFQWPERVRYRTRLVGFDEVWSEPSSDRSASWTNLPPGDYLFEVEATLGGGWSPAPARLAFRRTPAFTETWAWTALLWLGSIGSVVFVALLRGRRLHRRREELEALVQARTEELSSRTEELGVRNVELEDERARVAEQAARLLELDALRVRLVSDLSHELRTPLSLVAGPLADLSRCREQLSPKLQASLRVVRRNADRLEALIEQLFDVARLDSGAIPLRVRPLELGAFLRRTTERFSAEAARRGLDWQMALDSEARVFFDPDLIDKVVSNLLSNALKFTAEGGRVSLRLDPGPVDREPDEGVVTVEVIDTGIGVSPDQRAQLFERFYQGDQGDTRHFEGAGIGLSLARDLVALHGGEIGVDSTLSEGSRFWFTLPRGAAHLSLDDVDLSPMPAGSEADGGHALDEEPGPRQARLAPPDAPLLLLVEDHPDMRAFLASHLGQRYRLHQAADGQEALEKIAQECPDVVVSDVMMPRMDGLSLCRHLRADPATAGLPVLLLSAKAAEEDRLAGLELASDYLTKPVRTRELLARVRKLVERSSPVGAASARPGPVSGDEPLAAGVPAADCGSSGGLSLADRALLERIEAALLARLSERDFGVAQLARAVAMSRSKLQRTLRRLVDQTPTDFVQGLRMREGQRLLREGRLSTVSEVAGAVGMSPNYFYRVYSRWFGHPPSDELSG